MESDTLDSSIATVEQQIRDVEASIRYAESEATKAKDAGDVEERKVWLTEEQQLRTKEQQLRTEEQQLRDEKATLQQGKIGNEEPGMPTGAMEADPAMKAFWQNLHAAEMKQQTVSVLLDPGEEPIPVEVTTLELAGGTKFMGLKRGLSSILIPDSYCKLWEEVAPLVEVDRTSTAKLANTVPVRFIYTGTPGIGNSVAGWYFMYELRRRYGSEVDMVYQSERRGRQYLFRGSGQVWSMNTALGSFREHLMRPTTVYLVDGAGVVEVKAATFVFCTPDTRNYGGYRKASSVKLRYLPVWSLQQLLVSRQLFYQHVSEKRMRELHAKWGGVPRAVLEKADLESYQCNAMEDALDWPPHLSNILATVGAVAAADDSSSKILHFDVDPDNIGIKVVFASQWLADTLVIRAWQQAEADVRYFLSAREHDPQAAGMRGQVFKSFAHKQLQWGGTFTVRDLSDDSHAAAEVETWPAMRYQEFSKVTEVSDCPAALYMVPQARNSKAFDAVCPPRDALQMTVCARHPISHIGLVKLQEAMPTLQRLIFVVPAGIFEDFKAQQLVSSGSYPSPLEQNQTSLAVRAVKQYALKLPI